MNLNKLVLKFVSVSFSILVILLVIVGLMKLGTFCYDFGYRVFTEPPIDEAPGRDVVLQITDDMSEHDIGELLEEKGLVRDGTLFYAQLKLSAYSGKLIPGIYTLNTSMGAKDMMVVMAATNEPETEEQPDDGAAQASDEALGTEDAGTEEATDTGEET